MDARTSRSGVRSSEVGCRLGPSTGRMGLAGFQTQMPHAHRTADRRAVDLINWPSTVAGVVNLLQLWRRSSLPSIFLGLSHSDVRCGCRVEFFHVQGLVPEKSIPPLFWRYPNFLIAHGRINRTMLRCHETARSVLTFWQNSDLRQTDRLKWTRTGADFHRAMVATAPREKFLIGRSPMRNWTRRTISSLFWAESYICS